MKETTKIRPSADACKKFVTKDLPKIMSDLQRKGKLPLKYLTSQKAANQ